MPANDYSNRSILDRFTSVQLPESAIITSAKIEPQLCNAASAILANTERSREQSLALTALEEAKMWALRAAAVDAQARGEDTPPLAEHLQNGSN